MFKQNALRSVAAAAFSLGLTFTSMPAHATGAPTDAAMQQLLNSYCTQCHNSKSAKANVVLDNLTGARAAAKMAVTQLTQDKMPPSTATQPSTDDRSSMIAWFTAAALSAN